MCIRDSPGKGRIKLELNHLGDYDVAVIGAGHAGIEAAVAAAKLGARTALFTISLDGIANLPCNPSIGGTAKGHLVREIDALGGVMGLAADATFLQSRMLNLGKGPAVHSLRVQTDRKRYHLYMKHLLEQTPGLEVKQAEITRVHVEGGRVRGVETNLHAFYGAKAVVLATGTSLGGRIFVGDASYAGGPDGMHASVELVENLKALGLPLRRFKTGTPARVHRRSIDFSKLTRQPGDDTIQPFSFLTQGEMKNQVDCWIASVSYTHLVYYLLGMLGAILAAALTGSGTTYYLNLSLFFAFAILYPDFQVLLFFIIPLKMKYLSLIHI